MRKKIIKWHVGEVSDNGLQCLYSSVTSVQKIYPELECHILYNNIDMSKLDSLFNLGIHFHDQKKEYISSFPIAPILNGYQYFWKLYPPRLDLNSHEISIDNDLVIFDKIKEIDLFLDSEDKTLLYQGLHGFHGFFDSYVPNGVRINSGIFGMPPKFDFIKIMNENFKIDKWRDKHDEQGLVATVLLKSKKYLIIPLTTIPIVESDFDIDALTNYLCCGYHFVGLNYKNEHMSWEKYLKNKKKEFKFI